MLEEINLDQFLDSYEEVAGQRLVMLEAGERPDFICARPSGKKVGVELTRPSHEHEMAVWDRIWAPDRTMDHYDLLNSIQCSIETKGLKLSSADWRLPKANILVVQLVDYTFDSFAWIREISLHREFASAGFVEIWLSDHTTLEAHGSVRLIGLHPMRYWGVHRQSSLEGKPYG